MYSKLWKCGSQTRQVYHHQSVYIDKIPGKTAKFSIREICSVITAAFNTFINSWQIFHLITLLRQLIILYIHRYWNHKGDVRYRVSPLLGERSILPRSGPSTRQDMDRARMLQILPLSGGGSVRVPLLDRPTL